MIIPVKPDANGNIDIFYEGDENVTQVHFENPDSDFKWALHYLRRGDKRPYNVPLDEADGELIWTVALADTEKPGTGFAQLVGSAEGQTKHSRPYTVTVGKSLGKPGSVPSAEKAFGDAVATDAAAAKRAAEDAEKIYRYVKQGLEDGSFVGPAGPQGPRGEAGPAGKDAPQIDDGAISRDTPWSSRKIIDTLCPALDESGNPVTGYPVAGYPLGCKVRWEPTQAGSGEPYPAGGGPQLLDISRCTATVGKPYGLTITIDGDIIKCSGVPSDEVTSTAQYSFAVASSPQEELRGKGYKVTAWPIKGKVSNAWGLWTADESSLAIAAELSPGVNMDIHLRLMVSKDTPTAYAPYENIRPISGRNAVSVERCGENLMDILKYAPNGYNLSGKNILKPNTTYTFSPIKSGNIAFAVFLTDSIEPTESKRQMNLTGIYCNEGASVTFTTPNETSEFPYIWIAGAKDGIHLVWPDVKFMLAVATTAPAAYTPYRGDTLALQLPKTVYGGKVDAVTGDGEKEWAYLTLDGSETIATYRENDNTDTYKGFYINLELANVSERRISICSHFHNGRATVDGYYPNTILVHPEGQIYIRTEIPGVIDVDTFKVYLAAQYAAGTPVQIAYKLAEPVSFQATGNGPIMPLDGETNTIMTDADSITVTGRADPIRIIQQLQAAQIVATQQLAETQQEVVDTAAMTVDYIYEQDSKIFGGEDDDDQTDAVPT